MDAQVELAGLDNLYLQEQKEVMCLKQLFLSL